MIVTVLISVASAAAGFYLAYLRISKRMRTEVHEI